MSSLGMTWKKAERRDGERGKRKEQHKTSVKLKEAASSVDGFLCKLSELKWERKPPKLEVRVKRCCITSPSLGFFAGLLAVSEDMLKWVGIAASLHTACSLPWPLSQEC